MLSCASFGPMNVEVRVLLLDTQKHGHHVGGAIQHPMDIIGTVLATELGECFTKECGDKAIAGALSRSTLIMWLTRFNKYASSLPWASRSASTISSSSRLPNSTTSSSAMVVAVSSQNLMLPSACLGVGIEIRGFEHFKWDMEKIYAPSSVNGSYQQTEAESK